MENTKPERAPQRGDKYILRLPEGLRDRIAEAAKAADRSMNTEFVRRIEQSFEPNESALPLPVDLRDKLEAHAEEFGRTLTEEILHRLSHSFDWEEHFIPARLGTRLNAYRKEYGLDSKEAVDQLLTAGLHKDAPAVVVLTLNGDIELSKVVAALEEAKKRLPEKAVVLVEHHTDARPKRAAKKKP
jgi:hypothetical protein